MSYTIPMKKIPTKEQILANPLYKRDGYIDNYYNKRNELIAEEYKNFTMTVEKLAIKYNLSVRTIQRIAKSAGVVRTIAEANRLATPFKNYKALRVPEYLKAKRKTLPKKLRYKMLHEHPFCKTCGTTTIYCPLQVDHIDGDATNNNLENLQVLCMECNYGKR